MDTFNELVPLDALLVTVKAMPHICILAECTWEEFSKLYPSQPFTLETAGTPYQVRRITNA